MVQEIGYVKAYYNGQLGKAIPEAEYRMHPKKDRLDPKTVAWLWWSEDPEHKHNAVSVAYKDLEILGGKNV